MVARIVTAPHGAWIVEQKTLEDALVVAGVGSSAWLRRLDSG